MEEPYTLSAGRLGVVVSKVEPGTLEHQQGARHAVTIYCDEKPIVGYAYIAMRRGEGECAEANSEEGPDLVDFVFSERDLKSLEVLLARAHKLVRDLRNNPHGAEDSHDALERRGRE